MKHFNTACDVTLEGREVPIIPSSTLTSAGERRISAPKLLAPIHRVQCSAISALGPKSPLPATATGLCVNFDRHVSTEEQAAAPLKYGETDSALCCVATRPSRHPPSGRVVPRRFAQRPRLRTVRLRHDRAERHRNPPSILQRRPVRPAAA